MTTACARPGRTDNPAPLHTQFGSRTTGRALHEHVHRVRPEGSANPSPEQTQSKVPPSLNRIFLCASMRETPKGSRGPGGTEFCRCTVGTRSDIRGQRAGEGQGECWTPMRAPSHFNSHSTARPPNTNLRERKHGQLALIVPHAGTDEETRAARGDVLRIYLEGRLRGLDTSTRESVRALLGDDMARVAAARDKRRTVTLRSLTLSPPSSSERAPCTDY